MPDLAPSALADLQARLQDYVLGNGSGLDNALLMLAGETAKLGGSVGSSGSSDKGKRRLSIYHSAYRSRLQGVLGSAFERTSTYLGDEHFDAVSARYIESHSSHSRNLRDYGGDFPRFLRQALPADTDVAELATMDWLLHSAFDAPNANILSGAELAVIDETQWATLGFVFHPSVSLALFEWNVLDIWHALEQEAPLPGAERLSAPLGHLFWCKAERGYFRTLGEEEYAALKELLDGHSFASVCEELARTYPNTSTETSVGTWLARWLADELLSAVELEPGSIGLS